MAYFDIEIRGDGVEGQYLVVNLDTGGKVVPIEKVSGSKPRAAARPYFTCRRQCC